MLQGLKIAGEQCRVTKSNMQDELQRPLGLPRRQLWYVSHERRRAGTNDPPVKKRGLPECVLRHLSELDHIALHVDIHGKEVRRCKRIERSLAFRKAVF